MADYDDSWLATNGPDEMPNEDPPEWGFDEVAFIEAQQNKRRAEEKEKTPPEEGFDPLSFDELKYRIQTESDSVCRYCETIITGAMVFVGGDPFHPSCAPLAFDDEETRPRCVRIDLPGIPGAIGWLRKRIPGTQLYEVVVGVDPATKEKRVLRIHANDFDEIDFN